MDKLNKMQIPKYYSGGQPGGNSGAGNGNQVMLVELSSATIQELARATDKPVVLYAGVEKLADSVNKGNAIIAQKGGRTN